MKKILFTALILPLLIFSCSGEGDTTIVEDESSVSIKLKKVKLTGTWTYQGKENLNESTSTTYNLSITFSSDDSFTAVWSELSNGVDISSTITYTGYWYYDIDNDYSLVFTDIKEEETVSGSNTDYDELRIESYNYVNGQLYLDIWNESFFKLTKN